MPGIVSTLYAVYHPKETTSPQYVDYYFSNDLRLNKYLKPLVNIGAKHDMKINNEFALTGNVAFPGVCEQREIAEFLSKFDSRIAKQRDYIEALKKYKRGLLSAIFERRIRFKADDGSDFPEWEGVALGDVVKRVTRKNSKNECQRPLTISAQYGLVDQEEFFSKQIAAKDMSGYYLLKNGEFAYNKSYSNDYPIGAIKRLDRYESGVVSTLYICFVPTKIDSDFLTHYFESTAWHRQVKMISAEGARNHGLLNIAPSQFFETIHLIPSIPEQKRIAAFLSDFNKKEMVAEQQLEFFKTLRQGLLQQLFI